MKTQIENLSAILSPNSGKEEVSSLVQQIVSNVEDGNTNALEVFIHLHKLAKVAEDVRSKIMDAALSEAAKHGGKGSSAFGVDFSVAEAGVRYDFSETNDPILAEILEKETEIKAKKSEREKFLKSLPGKLPIVIEETGELVEVFPPIKKSSTVLKISLK